MNIGSIFALFGSNENNKNTKKELEVFKETPHFKIRMFSKLISQGMGFRNQVLNF
jgi:hypothetical protein